MGMRDLRLVIKDGKVLGWTYHFQIYGYELRECTGEEIKNLPEVMGGEDGIYFKAAVVGEGKKYETFDQWEAITELNDAINSYYFTFVPLNKGMTSQQKKEALFKSLKKLINDMESGVEPVDINFGSV